MSQAASPALPSAVLPIVPAIPVRQILPWAIFAGLLLLIAMSFVSLEQGAFGVFTGEGVHEWVHDGRHLLGFPCH